jgi:hypothetical protein
MSKRSEYVKKSKEDPMTAEEIDILDYNDMSEDEQEQVHFVRGCFRGRSFDFYTSQLEMEKLVKSGEYEYYTGECGVKGCPGISGLVRPVKK